MEAVRVGLLNIVLPGGGKIRVGGEKREKITNFIFFIFFY